MIKRLFDIAASSIALVILGPVIAGTAVFVAARIGRPVLFTQDRAGRDGKPFRMYKFRTMTNATDAQNRLLPDAQRLTPAGRFLRSTSLDELPSLINILKGDMSIVGPRPLHVHYLPRYSVVQARRHEVRPGLTGYAQVNGRNALSWEDRFALDVWYVENRSFLLDLLIIARTVWKVFDRSGINSSEAATMNEFMGSGEPTDGR